MLATVAMLATNWRRSRHEAFQVVAVVVVTVFAAVAIRSTAEPVLALDNSAIFAICGVFLCIRGALMHFQKPTAHHHHPGGAAVPALHDDDRAAPRRRKGVEENADELPLPRQDECRAPSKAAKQNIVKEEKDDARERTEEDDEVERGNNKAKCGDNNEAEDGDGDDTLIANSTFAAGFWTLLTGSVGGPADDDGDGSGSGSSISNGSIAAAVATRDILKSIGRWDRNSAANVGNIRHLLQYNKRWAAAVKAANPGYFEELAKQQTPKYMWIGCSDSRVPANQIVGLAPGEVFVHRNVGNVVSRCDLNCLSVLQYAVDVLKVEHIIVCGHFKCGGVTAAHDNHRCGLVDTWIMNIVDVKQRFDFALQEIPAEHHLAALHDLNVIRQVGNAADTHTVQDHWGKERAGDPAMQSLRVHGLMYSLKDGLLHELITLNAHSNSTSLMYEAVKRVVRHYKTK